MRRKWRSSIHLLAHSWQGQLRAVDGAPAGFTKDTKTMSEVWYRVDYSWTVDIVPVKVQRSTDKMVVLENGYKEHKESSGRRYFADFDDAATFANERMEIKQRVAQEQVIQAEKNATELWVSIQRIRDAIKDGVI